MAAVTAKLFSTVLTNKINGKIEKWRSSTNQEIINEKQLNNEINNIVREIVERNDTTEKPFAIKNENTLLSYTEKYANILRLQYPEYAVLVNTSAINTWIDNVLENIINNNPNYLKAMLIDTTILNIIKTSFLEVYQNLPCFN
jgi:hypothetical protein